ncbi:MAG: hypothetical protein GKS05_03715 [Nitrospirales bacterium]|nr:hypothetical protein [Nitrospirales bacterium]
MNSQLLLLVELQELDLKIHDTQRQQSIIPQQITAAQTPLLDATRRLEEVGASLVSIAAERRSSEEDLSAHEAHIQKMRARLSDLKTNKEYQAHLFEIELANKKKDGLEERVLRVMVRDEEAQKEQEQLAQVVKDAAQAYAQEKALLESRVDSLKSELAQQEDQQKHFVALMDKTLYHRYTTLKSARNIVVVASMQDEACGGCRLQLPPQLGAEVRRSEELQNCPYCQRILYSEQAIEDAKQTGSILPDEAGEEV